MPTRTLRYGGGGSPDHTTTASFVSWAQANDPFADDLILKVEWASSANVVTDELNFTGVTMGTNRLIIEAQSGQSWRDHANVATNVRAYDASLGACWERSGANQKNIVVDSSVQNLTIRNLQFRGAPSNFYSELMNVRASADLVIENNIFELRVAGQRGVYIRPDGASTIAVRNNFFHCTAAVGWALVFSQAGVSSTPTVVNNTFANTGSAGSSIGIRYESAYFTGATHRNNAFVGFATDASFNSISHTARTNNATSLSSGASGLGGTSNQYDAVGADEFESFSGTIDLRLKSTSAKLKDNGTSTDAPSTDSSGASRNGTTDIGAHEYQSGGGGLAANPLFGGGAACHPIRGFVA